MTRPILRGERIELRPLTREHAELLVELDSDPEVMRYITGRASTREEVMDIWLARRTRPADDVRGLGYWVGFDADRFLGWWSLAPFGEQIADSDPVELGYRLRRSEWGQGYAGEGARLLLDHGFTWVGLDRVVAEAMAVHTRSRGVLEEVGLRHVVTEFRQWDEPLPGAELGEVVYEISREAWAGGLTGRRRTDQGN